MNAKEIFSKFFSGTLSKNAMLTKLVPLVAAVLLMGYFLAGLVFPAPFDWRVMVISDLINPQDNPPGYLFPTIGMTAGAFLMIPFLGYYQKKLGKICRGSTGVGTAFMFIGIVSFIGVGTIAQFDLVPRLHEYLAGLGFIGIVFAGLFYGCPILKDHSKGAKQFNMRLFTVAIIVLLIPVIGLALSSLYDEIMDLPWASNPSIEKFELHHFPAWISFAFWEWVLFVGVMAYIFMLATMVPENVIPFEKKR